MLVVVIASVTAAVLYGAGASLQRHGLLLASPTAKMNLKLLPKLLVQPIWMAGSLLAWVGIILELIALHRGSLTIVITLLSTGLVVALGFDAVLTKAHLPLSAWVLSTVVAAGTAVFVVSVGNGTSHAANQTYLLITTVLAILVAALLWWLPGLDNREPWLMGSGAAVVLAVSTGLAKGAIAKGMLPALVNWDTYAALAIGLFGTVLLQHAYKSGPLAKSLPANTVVQPVAGILMGIWCFSEQFGVGSLKIALATGSLVVTLIVLWVLSKSVASALPSSHEDIYGAATAEQGRETPATILSGSDKRGEGNASQAPRRPAQFLSDSRGDNIAQPMPATNIIPSNKQLPS
ncbi:MAG: DMT family transporter [Acidimicrobiales bacterium]